MEIEYFRQELASIKDYEPYTVFKRMDPMNKGLIGAANFMLLMK